MVLESPMSGLPGWKQAVVFLMAIFTISLPSIFGQMGWFREAEPAFVSLLIGLISSLIAYPIFKLGFTDLTQSSILSATVLMGLVAAHVSVFHVTNHFVGVMTYVLFLFVFYWDFAEGSLTNASDEKHKERKEVQP
jgi:hypothetical protein